MITAPWNRKIHIVEKLRHANSPLAVRISVISLVLASAPDREKSDASTWATASLGLTIAIPVSVLVPVAGSFEDTEA